VETPCVTLKLRSFDSNSLVSTSLDADGIIVCNVLDRYRSASVETRATSNDISSSRCHRIVIICCYAMSESRNQLTQLSSGCESGACPTVYRSDEAMLIVQGYTTSLDTPDGEDAVRIPESVFLEAARQLQDTRTTTE
jgi:hypothetical protein